jgi:Bacteriophage clamp loader A subunit
MSNSETKKAASIFDHISHLTDKKVSWDTLSEIDKKSFSPYMINRWLSMNIDFIELINELQRYTIGQVSAAETYKLYYDILPKQKQFNKYIKSKKEDKYNAKLIELISIHFSISNKEAMEYIDMYIEKDVNDLRKIIKQYGKTEKEILSLLKKEK